jgi:hypothetical protein
MEYMGNCQFGSSLKLPSSSPVPRELSRAQLVHNALAKGEEGTL